MESKTENDYRYEDFAAFGCLPCPALQRALCLHCNHSSAVFCRPFDTSVFEAARRTHTLGLVPSVVSACQDWLKKHPDALLTADLFEPLKDSQVPSA